MNTNDIDIFNHSAGGNGDKTPLPQVESLRPLVRSALMKDELSELDAGILIWGGKPKIKVFEGLSNVAGNNTAGYLRSADKYPVYPEASIRISQRIW